MTPDNRDIETLALASYFRRAKRSGGSAIQPSSSSTTIDEPRKRVVFRNGNGPITAMTYRDDGNRVVFRDADLEPEDDNY